MGFKADLKNKTGEFLSSTVEIFDKIFRPSTQQAGVKKKPKPAAQGPLPSHAPKKLRSWGETLTAEKSHARPTVKRRTGAPAKTKTRKPSKGKGSPILRVGLLLFLLLVLAGFLANHFAIIDLSATPDLLGLESKQVLQAPIHRGQPTKPPEKPVTSPKPSQTAEKVSEPLPAPSVQAPPAMSEEEKLLKLETPTTGILQSGPGQKPAEEKAPSVAAQTLPMLPAPQYPYSVYLGSFKAPEAVNKALSEYQGKGLSPYWARVDLGDKGVWFRFFTGHFRTKEEAEKFIGERNLPGAAPGFTKYANWIGNYSSEKEAEDQRKALVSAGFHPYIINEASGRRLIYSGAFDRKEFAEKDQSALASKGIKSHVVER